MDFLNFKEIFQEEKATKVVPSQSVDDWQLRTNLKVEHTGGLHCKLGILELFLVQKNCLNMKFHFGKKQMTLNETMLLESVTTFINKPQL